LDLGKNHTVYQQQLQNLLLFSEWDHFHSTNTFFYLNHIQHCMA
jgi:hypothetical protein